MRNLFGTLRAFFSGFSALARQGAASRLRRHGVAFVAGLLALTYYFVQAYYFLHHTKVAPGEKVSDLMGLFFQCCLAPVFYMGFRWLVSFILRDDVQAAYARFAAARRKNALWAWWTGSAVTRAIVSFCVTVAKIVMLLLVALLGLVGLIAAVVTRRLGRQVNHARAFARTCVETGQQNAQ